jgi:sugar fermentation stimulation protein A
MKNLLIKGAPVCFSESSNPSRKLKYTLEGIFIDNQWIFTNTSAVNSIVYSEILKGRVGEFSGFTFIKREYTLGNKRLDFYIEKGEEKYLIEVKSVSLFENGYSMFPDAVTKRGQSHLLALKDSLELGFRPYIFYVIQSCYTEFRCASEIDPAYCKLYQKFVPKYITPLFYRHIFNPYSETSVLEKVEKNNRCK